MTQLVKRKKRRILWNGAQIGMKMFWILKKTEKMMEELRETLGDIPLLFTFRTLKEGGEKEIEKSVYVKLNEMAVKTGFADLVDGIEFTDR